ncbi:hypothetical protein L1049_003100 [Liquidambar formosana]|uniref:Phytocyanin domain-containing protein n=1 Tax=Liquidambar formosana TaxID=63359 RepID=A0AAP0NHA9_LIQFO
MASHFMGSAKFILLSLTIFSFLHHFSVFSFEFQVGGTNGWVVPRANDSKVYNDWASENRFLVGDTVRFKYKKDSVMEVTDADYKRCNSTHPNLFSNTGNTVYELDRPGSFYFISGVSGHCERGQRMIIKVLTSDDAADGGDSSSGSRAAVLSFGVSKLVVVQFVLSCVASYLY